MTLPAVPKHSITLSRSAGAAACTRLVRVLLAARMPPDANESLSAKLGLLNDQIQQNTRSGFVCIVWPMAAAGWKACRLGKRRTC